MELRSGVDVTIDDQVWRWTLVQKQQMLLVIAAQQDKSAP